MRDTQAYTVRGEDDRAFFDRELASFVPDRVFDAHCHIWAPGHPIVDMPQLPPSVGLEELKRYLDDLHPGRKVGGLILSFDFKAEDVPAANEWVSKQVAKDPNFRGAFFVRPNDDPDWVRQEVRRLKLHGLKCYHTYSSTKPTWVADIPTYLPEPLVKMAHEEGLTVTLHMVKTRSVADPSNVHWIRHYCTRYPDMKLILAHSARGFQPAHNFEGLPQLADLDNLYCDSSANCDPMAHQAIIRILGHKKLMYGSDFMVSHMRGRSVCCADSFIWLYENAPVWGEKHTKINPVLIGFEHLRSMKWACWAAKLKDSQVEDIFWNNAAKLFGLGKTFATKKKSANTPKVKR